MKVIELDKIDAYMDLEYDGKLYNAYTEDIDAVAFDAILLPDNATNGDVIKTMFPNAKVEHGLYGINGVPLIFLNLGTRNDVHEMAFVEDWWNAPYKEIDNANAN